MVCFPGRFLIGGHAAIVAPLDQENQRYKQGRGENTAGHQADQEVVSHQHRERRCFRVWNIPLHGTFSRGLLFGSLALVIFPVLLVFWILSIPLSLLPHLQQNQEDRDDHRCIEQYPDDIFPGPAFH